MTKKDSNEEDSTAVKEEVNEQVSIEQGGAAPEVELAEENLSKDDVEVEAAMKEMSEDKHSNRDASTEVEKINEEVSNREKDSTPKENFPSEGTLSYVNPALFETPVQRIGVSGGTAPFFSLKIVPKDVNVAAESTGEGEVELIKESQEATDLAERATSGEGVSLTKYIGKDLSRARDEVTFYEELLRSGPEALGPLNDFTFSYLGILKTAEAMSQESQISETQGNELELLVLENLFDGKKKLRLLDLKIGSRTASAGWKGKGHLGAIWQQMFDRTTNSVKEGYRLEGFDGCPESLKSIKPILEQLSNSDGKSKLSRKSRRILYQSLAGTKIFQHLLDLHTLSPADANATNEDCYDVDEYLEITMNEIVRCLTKLVIACYKLGVPQKWIGSSLAIGFDAGEIPKRSKKEAAIRDATIVRIFDWGRSELNHSTRLQEMSPKEIKDREYFWEGYLSGITTISWIATHKYKMRFCCPSWKYVSFAVYDHDALSSDDLISKATVPLEETESKETPLLASKNRKGGYLTYSIKWVEFRKNSRLKGAWKVKIESAKDLPNLDVPSLKCTSNTQQLSDPYVVVTAEPSSNEERIFSFELMTTMIENTCDPVWNETLSIPVSREGEDYLAEAFECADLHQCCNGLSMSKDDWKERVKSSV